MRLASALRVFSVNTRRWMVMVIGGGGLAIGIVIALFWWNERALQRVEEQLATGDAAGALAAAETYLEMRPGHGQAIALRARALVALGRVQEAKHLFDHVGAAHPEDLRAWSTALLSLGEWQQALPILLRLQQVDPMDHETLEAIAVCQFELGRHQAAIAASKRLTELPGHEVTGHLQLASIYRATGQATLANQHFEMVLQNRADARGLEMEPAEFFLAYGESLLLSGDARKALEVLERRGQLESNPNAWLRQGEAWQLIGNYAKAREFFDKLVRQNPDHRLVRERLAELALRENDPASVLHWLPHSHDHEGITANQCYLLQRAYTALGDESLAQQWQEKTAARRRVDRQLAALQMEARKDPESPRARLITAYLSAADGNWKTAGRVLAALLRQVPDTYAESFVRQLAQAIREQGTLPPVESMPASFNESRLDSQANPTHPSNAKD